MLEALAIELEAKNEGEGETLWLARPRVKALFTAEIQTAFPIEKDPVSRAEAYIHDLRTHFRLLNAFDREDASADSQDIRSGDADAFRLLHRTFEEFFVASALKRRIAEQGVEAVWPLVNLLFSLPRYREILAFLCGLLAVSDQIDPLASLLNRAGDTKMEDTFRHRLSLVNWCLGQIPQRVFVRQESASSGLGQVRRKALSDDMEVVLHWVRSRINYLSEYGGDWHAQPDTLHASLPEIGSSLLDASVHTVSPFTRALLHSMGLLFDDRQVYTCREFIQNYLPALCRSPYAVPLDFLIAAKKGFASEYSQAYHKGSHENWPWVRDSFQAEFLLTLLTHAGSHPIWDGIIDVVGECLQEKRWNYVLHRLLSIGLQAANRAQSQRWQRLIGALHSQTIFARSMCSVEALQALSPRQRREVIDVNAALSATMADQAFWFSEPDPLSTWPHVPSHVFQLKAILDAQIDLSENQRHLLIDFLLRVRRIDLAAHFLCMLTEYPNRSGLLRNETALRKAWEWFYALKAHPDERVAFWSGSAAICLLRLDPSDRARDVLKTLLSHLVQGKIRLASSRAECSLIQNLAALWETPGEKDIRFLFDTIFPPLREQEEAAYLIALANLLTQLLPRMEDAAVVSFRAELLRLTRDAVDAVMADAAESEAESLSEATLASLLLRQLETGLPQREDRKIQEAYVQADYRFKLASLLQIQGYDFPQELNMEAEKSRMASLLSLLSSQEKYNLPEQKARQQQYRVARFGLDLLTQSAEYLAAPETVRQIENWLDTYGHQAMAAHLQWSPLDFLNRWQRRPLPPETTRELLRLLEERTHMFEKRACAIALSGSVPMLAHSPVRLRLESDLAACHPAHFRASLRKRLWAAFQQNPMQGAQRFLLEGVRLLPNHPWSYLSSSRDRVLCYNLWQVAFRDRVRVNISDFRPIYVAEIEQQVIPGWQQLPRLQPIR